MRTDCKVTRHNVKMPYSVFSRPGFPSEVCPGDVIEWSAPGDDNGTYVGRVIGKVSGAHDLETGEPLGTLICVARLLCAQGACENWIRPEDVVAAHPLSDKISRWLFSEDFEKTPIDEARQCFDRTALDLIRGYKA